MPQQTLSAACARVAAGPDFNSGEFYRADTGLPRSLTLTFTRPGIFPYVDVGDFFMEMQGSVIVTPP